MTVSPKGPTVARILATVDALPSPSAASPSNFGVFLGPKAYAFAHSCIWLFQAVCVAYFISAGLLYHALASTRLAGMLQLYSLTIPRAYYKTIGIAHYVVAALYVRQPIVSLRSQLRRRLNEARARRLAGGPRLSLVHPKPSSSRRVLARTLSARVRDLLNRSRLWRVLMYVYGIVLSPSGFFGVESNHFEILFLIREVTETILQTNQAYQMSRLLPRARLNRVYVALLAINCWSTPFFYKVGGQNMARRRLLSLLCDVLLDFISAVGVPVWLALDYLSEYDPDAEDFPMSSWYSDVWVVRFVNDVSLMLLGSWVGAFSRLLFSISLLSTLDDIQGLLKRQQSSVQPTELATPASKPAPVSALPTSPKASIAHRLVSWTHLVVVLYGCGIVGVQMYAETRPTPAACVLVVRPWLVTQPACALIEINCLTNPTLTGDQSDFTRITGSIDELSLEHLVVRHCPRLEITSRLQAFHSLIGLKLYNSTIIDWGADAALAQSHHSRLRFLYLVHTRFPHSTLPQGLLSREFPSDLRDIEISGSNLNTLPDDLHERWPQRLTLFIEFAELTAFPHVLTELSPVMLVLGGNPITQLPAEALLLPAAYSVSFTASQLVAFPDSGVVPQAVFTTSLYAEMSNVAVLPEWMDEQFLTKTTLYLGGTPFCVDVLLNESSPEREQLLAKRPYLQELVDCNELDPILWPFYPQYLDVRDDEQALLTA